MTQHDGASAAILAYTEPIGEAGLTPDGSYVMQTIRTLSIGEYVQGKKGLIVRLADSDEFTESAKVINKLRSSLDKDIEKSAKKSGAWFATKEEIRQRSKK